MSKDKDKTKEQLINELMKMRQRIAKLNPSETERENAKKQLSKLSPIADAMVDGVTITDLDGRISYVNRAVTEQLGYEKEELIGKTPAEFIAEKDLPKFAAEVKKVLLNKQTPKSSEYLAKHKDGTKIPMSVTFSVLNHLEGNPKGIIAVSRDITELKKGEEEIRKFKTVSDDAGYGVAMSDLEGHLIYVNDSFAEMHGYTADELIGKSLSIFHNEEQLKNVNRLKEKLRQQGSYLAEEVWHKRKDNSVFLTLMNGTLIKDEKGKPLSMAATAIDITERKKAEEALRASEGKYRTLVESTTDFIYMIDKKNKVLSLNKSAARLFGKKPEEVIGKSIFDLFPKEIAADFSKNLKETLKTGSAQIEESKMIVADKEMWISTSLSPVRGHQGEVMAVMGVTRDITERKKAQEALQESQEKLSQIVQGSPVPAFVIDSKHIVTHWNRACENLTGISADEVIGTQTQWMPFYSVERPLMADLIVDNAPEEEIAKRYGSKYQKSTLIEGACRAEDFFPDLGEAGRWLFFTAAPLKNAEGRVIGAIETLQDITDRKKAEQALREASSIINRSPAVAFTWRNSEGWPVEFVSENVLNLFGYTSEEFTSGEVSYAECVHPDDLQRVALEVETFSKEEDRTEFVHEPYRIIAKDGTEKLISDWTFITRDKEGNITHYKGIVQDITDRKRAEEKIKQAAEEWKTTFNSISDLVSLHNKEFKFLRVNRAYADIFKVKPEELIGKTCYEVVHGTKEPHPFCPHKQAVETERPVTTDFLEPNLGIHVEVSVSPILNEQNEVIGTVHIVKDITERKKMEEELMKIEKLESLGILAGGIAHDFNNILTAILGNITLAKMAVNPEDEIFEILTEAEKASLRTKSLTQQLLTFSKGGAPVKKTVCIAGLLKNSVGFALRGSNVRCEFSIPDELWPVEVDEGQMGQVINNLIINSDQAMPEGGTIKVSAENMTVNARHTLPVKKGEYIKISIEDQGTGIREEHLQKIFDPYFTTKQKGSGLGLAIVYSIIKNHNGYITVESELGVETTFRIYLPASKKKIPTKKNVEKRLIVGKGKILVMDDEEIVRDVAGSLLERAGYGVEFAEDGAEAIELYNKARESGEPFDAVIIDLTVPGGMGGKKVVEKLLEIDPEVKAIVSSGYSDDPIMANFKKYGFSGVVTKPYGIEELSEVLHKVITRTSELPSPRP